MDINSSTHVEVSVGIKLSKAAYKFHSNSPKNYYKFQYGFDSTYLNNDQWQR